MADVIPEMLLVFSFISGGFKYCPSAGTVYEPSYPPDLTSSSAEITSPLGSLFGPSRLLSAFPPALLCGLPLNGPPEGNNTVIPPLRAQLAPGCNLGRDWVLLTTVSPVLSPVLTHHSDKSSNHNNYA